MSDEYTPTTAEVRAEYLSPYSGGMIEVRGDEFDRMIAAAERVAAARALEEAADAWHAEHSGTRPVPYNWLRARAEAYRQEREEQ